MATSPLQPGIRPANPAPRLPVSQNSLAAKAVMATHAARAWLERWRAAGGGWCVTAAHIALYVPRDGSAAVPALNIMDASLRADAGLRAAVLDLIAANTGTMPVGQEG